MQKELSTVTDKQFYFTVNFADKKDWKAKKKPKKQLEPLISKYWKQVGFGFFFLLPTSSYFYLGKICSMEKHLQSWLNSLVWAMWQYVREYKHLASCWYWSVTDLVALDFAWWMFNHLKKKQTLSQSSEEMLPFPAQKYLRTNVYFTKQNYFFVDWK